MSIDNALASVAVKDIDKAAAWYARLLGSPGSRPLPEVVEWMLPRDGGLQVYEGAERARHCSLTLAVSDLEEVVGKLTSMGVPIGDRTAIAQVKPAMVKDPNGNSIFIAQSSDPSLAR